MKNLLHSLLLSLVLAGCSSSESEPATGLVDSTAASGEDAVNDSSIDGALAETLAEAPEDTFVPDTTPPYEPYDIQHILGTGQSLSVGAVGSPALSTMQPYANLMFSQGVIPGGSALTKLVPLVENGVETLSSALANDIAKHAREMFKGMDHVGLVSAHGIGGTAYSGLKKGTSAFTNGMAQVKAAKAIADASKRTYIVRAVTNVHGESDHVSGNKMYDVDLAQWQLDYETDVKAITGQSGSIPMLHTQMSSWTKYGQATSIIPRAQLDASRKSGGKLVLVGPKYTSIYTSDGVHLTNLGYRILGEYYAKVYRRIFLERGTWTPLQPRSIKRDMSTITIDFDVPTPPLEFDTTEVTDPGSFGFEVLDNGVPAKIMMVSIVGPNTVKIGLAAAPSGKAMRVRYAYTGTPNANAGPKTGARGNLRDSDTTPSAYAPAKLYNWCVHFDEAVP